jgi:hypothetical protein
MDDIISVRWGVSLSWSCVRRGKYCCAVQVGAVSSLTGPYGLGSVRSLDSLERGGNRVGASLGIIDICLDVKNSMILISFSSIF